MYEINLSLDVDVLCELGKSIVLFNCLEGMLNEIGSFFLTANGQAFSEEVATVLLAELSFRQSVGQVDSLLRWYADKSIEHRDVPVFANLGPPSPSKMLEQWSELRRWISAVEEDRNRFVKSSWAAPAGSTQGQLDIEILRKVVGQPHGRAQMSFGSRAPLEQDGLETEAGEKHIAVRSRTTSRPGKGLRHQIVPLTLAEIRTTNVRSGIALFGLGLFRAYFYEGPSESLCEMVDEYISSTNAERHF